MVTKAQLNAQYKYDKANTRQIVLKLNTKSDADILAKLQTESNKQGYIKELIRMNMRNTGEVLSLNSIRCLLLPIVKQYAIKSVSLFGSYARNEAMSGSDVDLIVEGGNFTGLVEYMNVVKAMENALGRSVDLITAASLENNNSPADVLFKEQIEREKVLLI